MNSSPHKNDLVPSRIVYGVVSAISVTLMYIFDVPALMYLGSGLVTAILMVTFFTMADRYSWKLVIWELFARLQGQAEEEYSKLDTSSDRGRFLKTKLGCLLTYPKLQSQVFGQHSIIFYSLFSFACLLTVLGMWFPIANRTMAIDKKENTTKIEKIGILNAKQNKQIKSVQDSIEVELQLLDDQANKELSTRKTSLENAIANLNTRVANANAAKEYTKAEKLATEKQNKERALNDIALNADFEVKKSTVRKQGIERISKINKAAQRGEEGIWDSTSFSTITQKWLYDILAVVAPLLVLLMAYLIVFYQLVTGDKRNTPTIIVHEIKKWYNSIGKQQQIDVTEHKHTPSVLEAEDVKIKEVVTVIAEKSRRQILPREIAQRIEDKGLELPKLSNIRLWASRRGTGDNDLKLIDALTAYEAELNLTSNFNSALWDFEGSTQPKFFGIIDEWTDNVPYSKKKPNDASKVVRLKNII